MPEPKEPQLGITPEIKRDLDRLNQPLDKTKIRQELEQSVKHQNELVDNCAREAALAFNRLADQEIGITEFNSTMDGIKARGKEIEDLNSKIEELTLKHKS